MSHPSPDAVRRGHPSPSLCQRVRRAALALILAVCLPLAALAQQPSAPAPQGAQSAPASGPQPTTRPMTMEIVIVFIMVGAAIFVVCKSSRRN